MANYKEPPMAKCEHCDSLTLVEANKCPHCKQEGEKYMDVQCIVSEDGRPCIERVRARFDVNMAKCLNTLHELGWRSYCGWHCPGHQHVWEKARKGG